MLKQMDLLRFFSILLHVYTVGALSWTIVPLDLTTEVTEPSPRTSTQPPGDGHTFILQDSNGSPCFVMLAANINVTVTYLYDDGNTSLAEIPVSTGTKASGYCQSHDTSRLRLDFSAGASSSLTLEFDFKIQNRFSYLKTVKAVGQLSIEDYRTLGSPFQVAVTNNVMMPLCPDDTFLSCESEQAIEFDPSVKLIISGLIVQPFGLVGNFTGSGVMCTTSSPDDGHWRTWKTVVIVVGGVLLLIALVVIAVCYYRRYKKEQSWLQLKNHPNSKGQGHQRRSSSSVQNGEKAFVE